MFKALRTLFFVASFVWLSASLAFEVPPLSGPVVDQTGVLSSEQLSQLAQKLKSIQASGGEQIQVLIIPTLNGEAIEQVAIQVFDQWKLGDQKKDDGVLFMVALNDRKLRIEVGQGLEGNIPDVIAKRIIGDLTRPLFRAQNYFAGIYLTTEAIHQAANQPEGQFFSVEQFKENLMSQPDLLSDRDRGYLQSKPERDGKKTISSTKVFLFLSVLWLIIFIYSPTMAIYILFSLFSGGRGGRGGGGGFGGGGWSGGGGSSSGGGASGDW